MHVATLVRAPASELDVATFVRAPGNVDVASKPDLFAGVFHAQLTKQRQSKPVVCCWRSSNRSNTRRWLTPTRGVTHCGG